MGNRNSAAEIELRRFCMELCMDWRCLEAVMRVEDIRGRASAAAETV
jgi:hypothetical protein